MLPSPWTRHFRELLVRTWLVCRTPRLNRLGREARVARCDAPESQLATELGETHQECALDRSSILRTSTKDNRALPKGVHVFLCRRWLCGESNSKGLRCPLAPEAATRRAARGAAGASEATAHSPRRASSLTQILRERKTPLSRTWSLNCTLCARGAVRRAILSKSPACCISTRT